MTGPGQADLVVVGGWRFDPGSAGPELGGLAVRHGRIAAVSTDADIAALAGPATRRIDLAGGLVLPGFVDAHVHPAQGGLEASQCDLTGGSTRAGYLETVADYVAGSAAKGGSTRWVLGGGWSMDAFPGGVPTAADLDTVTGDRPVYLPNRDHHSAWVNTAALRLAGLTAQSPDPADGRIERDAAGEPSGALHEGAMDLVGRLVPAHDPATLVRAVLDGQRHLHRLGVTGWQDAIIGASSLMPDFFDAYLAADAAGQLTGRVRGALWWDRFGGVDQLDHLIDRRKRAAGCRRFSAGAVKIMVDGVCETRTAALLDDYLDPATGHADGTRGLEFVDAVALHAAARVLTGAGFQIHLHALGDAAVRNSLDALAATMGGGPAADLRHHIAHLQVVHPDDVPRFAELGVAANCQALWACADEPMTELTLPVLGRTRSRWQYPFRAIAAAGARLALGSDWPVSSADPLAIVQTAVTRSVPGDPSGGAFLPDQRLGLAEALTAATLGGNYLNFTDAVAGRLRPGFSADLTVLDRNLFAGPPTALTEATVLGTLVDGGWVYRHDALRAS